MSTMRTFTPRAALVATALAAMALGLASACLACPHPAQARSYAEELRLDMPNGVKYATTVFKADLTHDGKKDEVKVKPIMRNTASGSRGIRVYVRGNRALALMAPTGSARFSLYYVHMTDRLEFLAIAQPRGRNDAFTPGKLVLYRYAGKKLVPMADLSQRWGAVGRPAHSMVKHASKTGITVTATFDKSPLGARSYPLSYKYRKDDGSFVLGTASAKPVVAPRHWTASVREALYRQPAPARVKMTETVVKDPVPGSGAESTATTRTYYKKNEKVATMKKGAKVTGVIVHRDGYVKVKLESGASGWFKWAKYRKGRPFKEVGAGY